MLFKIEFKKLLSTNNIIILLSLLLLKILVVYNDDTIYPNINITIYQEYINELEGLHSTEKFNYLNEEYTRFSQYIDTYDDVKTQFLEKRISKEEYKTYLDNYYSSNARIDTVEYLLNKSTVFENSDNNNLYYFYDIHIEHYIKNIGLEYFVLIFILLISTTYYTHDYYSRTIYFLQTSQKGVKKLYLIKKLCLIIVATITSLLFQIVEFIVRYLSNDLDHLDITITSISGFCNYNTNITIAEYLVNVIIFKTLYTILCVLLISALACIFKNNIHVYGSFIFILFLGYILSKNLDTNISSFILFNGLSGSAYLKNIDNLYNLLAGIISNLVLILTMDYFAIRKL